MKKLGFWIRLLDTLGVKDYSIVYLEAGATAGLPACAFCVGDTFSTHREQGRGGRVKTRIGDTQTAIKRSRPAVRHHC